MTLSSNEATARCAGCHWALKEAKCALSPIWVDGHKHDWKSIVDIPRCDINKKKDGGVDE